MVDFNEYPVNATAQNALLIRQAEGPAYEVTKYSAEQLEREVQGPANPFRSDNLAGHKRKNVLTGHVENLQLSEHAWRTLHREEERRGAADPTQMTTQQMKAEAAQTRAKRQKGGDATIVEGAGAYVGPWAKYNTQQYDEIEVNEERELASDEEYVTDAEDVVESGAVVPALPQALAQRKQAEETGGETTVFHGSEQYDYQGRTYMHVPQDLDVDLRKEPGSVKNYVPKKLVHTWKSHTKPLSALRFFPGSGHLMLSASADTTVKLWDVYHERELLRTYSGHTKALCDTSFTSDGAHFLTSSYDRMMKLWDTETGQCVSRFTTGKTPHVVRFNPAAEHQHEFLAGMADKKIVQFDTRTRAVVQEYDHHLAAINTITFVDDNRRFMTTSDDKAVRAWDYNIPVPIKTIAEPYMFPLVRSSAHPSGKYVLYQSSDNQVLVYGCTERFRQNGKKSFRGHNNAGYAIDVACSPDGQIIASGDSGGYVCFWDWKTCKMWHKMQASEGAVTCLEWLPQETSKVVTAGLDGAIKLWD